MWDWLQLGLSAFQSISSARQSEDAIRAQNAANSAEAQKNRDWQERMSSTAHQREVADLRASGLNPILSATGGSGASSPGGSMAVMQNTKEQSTPIKAQMAKLMAETMATSALGAKSRSEARTADAEAKLANSGLKDKMTAQANSAKAAAKKASIDEKMAIPDAIAERLDRVNDALLKWIPWAGGEKKSAFRGVVKTIKQK